MEKKLIDYEGFEAYSKGVKEKYAEKKDIPTSLSNLQEDSTHQTVTDADKTKWNKVEDKVDKVDGKQLSSNDYTNEDKAKVDNIPKNPKYTDTTYDLSSFVTSKDLEGYKKADGTTVAELKAKGRVNADNIREEWFFAHYQSTNTPDRQKGWYINTMDFGNYFFQVAYDGRDKNSIYFRAGSRDNNWSSWQPLLTGSDLDKLASKKDLETIKDILPTKLSQFINDKNFKTESEIQSMIEKASSLKKEVVTSLPQAGKDDVIYLVKDEKGKDNNNYLEYLWLNGKYELIGSTQVDLSGYAKLEDIVASKVVDKYVLTKDFRTALSGDQEFLKAVHRDIMTLVVFGGNDKMKFVSEAGFESILYYKGQVVGVSLVPMDSQIDDGFVRGNNFDGGETYATSGLMKNYNKVIQRQFAELKSSQDGKLDKTKDKAQLEDVGVDKGYSKYVDANLLNRVTTNISENILTWIMQNNTYKEFTQQELEEAFK